MFRKIILLLLLAVTLPSLALAAGVQIMTTDQLKSNLNDTDTVILDARGPWDYVKTDDKIAGAFRIDPANVNAWADSYDRGKTIVLYCA